MPTQLTTQNATITTATIEVKALTIGARQVTLAVFRQLREEPLIAEGGTLNGAPWGTVNYHPDKCADAKEHLHVVWQQGDELRRAYVSAPKHAWHEHPAAGAFVTVLVANGLTREDNDPGIKVYGGLPGDGCGAIVQADGVQFHHGISRDCYSAFVEYGARGDQCRDPLRVLYFDRENSLRDIVTRMIAFGAKPVELQEPFDYRRFPKFTGGLDAAPVAVAELMTIVDDSKPDIVVLDTVSRFIEGKENDSDTWLALYRRVHAPLKDRGIAGVRLDHMGKDAERGSRGSSAKSQDVDHVWEMTRTDESLTREDGVETVATTIRMKRTHTRTGIGRDVLNVVRRGRKGPNGLWLPGETRHELVDAGAVRQQDMVIQSYVDHLLAAGVPGDLGRDALKAWAEKNQIPLPGKTTTLKEITNRVKAARGVYQLPE